MNLCTTFSAFLLLTVVFNAALANSLENPTVYDNNASLNLVVETPTFHISGKDVCVGESFSAPVKVSNFTMITSFQFTITWDNSKLTFNNLSDISADLGSTMLFNTVGASEGMLTASWYDLNVAGLTFDDFSEIFTLHFTAIAANQTNTGISFENEPTMMEVSGFVGNDVMVINAEFNDGAVNIDQQEMDSYEIINDVNNSNVGGVNIVIIHGTQPYSFSWSNDAETQNLTNVGVGSYNVTVTDAKGCVTSYGDFIVDNTLNVKRLSSLQSISLFPNPVAEELYVKVIFENLENVDVSVFNLVGERVLFGQYETASLDLQLKVAGFANGTYFLQLRTQDGLHTEKFEILR